MMYGQSSEKARSRLVRPREIFLEEMTWDWVLSVGGIWSCRNGVEGHSGWGTWGVQRCWET